MRLDELPRSDKVEDRRGDGPGGFPMGRAGGVGIGTIILLVIVGWALGINPLYLSAGRRFYLACVVRNSSRNPLPAMPRRNLHPIKRVSSSRPCLEARKSNGKRFSRKPGEPTRRRRWSCSLAPRAQHADLRNPPWARSIARTIGKFISIPRSFRISSGVSAAAMSEARAANSLRPT